MASGTRAKADALLKRLIPGRVYQATRGTTGLFYRVEQVQPDARIVVISSHNPNPAAKRRNVSRRAVHLESLAGYNLELVAPIEEPDELLSEDGKEFRVLAALPPPPWLQRETVEVVHLDGAADDLRHELERLFNSTPDGSRLLSEEEVELLASSCAALAAGLLEAKRVSRATRGDR